MTVNGLQVLDDSNSRVQFGPNYNRLQQLKAQYDPESVFPKWFSLVRRTREIVLLARHHVALCFFSWCSQAGPHE